MQKILAATDLSARGMRAAMRAIDLAKRHRSALRLLHVVDGALPQGLAKDQAEAVEAELHKWLKDLGTPPPDEVMIETPIGVPSLEVLSAGSAWGADLIVLGTHGIGHGGRGLFQGTTAERIIRLGHLPVLVVKADDPKPYERMLVGFDFSIHALRAVQTGLRLAPDAVFHLVHAFAPPPELLFGAGTGGHMRQAHVETMNRMIDEELQAFLARFGDKAAVFRREVQKGEPAEVLLAAATHHRPDVLAVGTHGRSGIAHAVIGSVAERMIEEAPCDVLVVKAW